MHLLSLVLHPQITKLTWPYAWHQYVNSKFQIWFDNEIMISVNGIEYGKRSKQTNIIQFVRIDDSIEHRPIWRRYIFARKCIEIYFSVGTPVLEKKCHHSLTSIRFEGTRGAHSLYSKKEEVKSAKGEGPTRKSKERKSKKIHAIFGRGAANGNVWEKSTYVPSHTNRVIVRYCDVVRGAWLNVKLKRRPNGVDQFSHFLFGSLATGRQVHLAVG